MVKKSIFSKNLSLALFSLIVFVVGIAIFFVPLLLYFTGYGDVASIWWKLRKIPNVEVLKVNPSASEGYVTAIINVKGKGKMTFSGWSLTDEQFKINNMSDIGLSEINSCKFIVIKDLSRRGWIILNREVDQRITTVQKAVENYEEILNKVKSFPRYVEGTQKEGIYSNCQ